MKTITILTLAFVSALLLGSVSADEKVDKEISRFVETYIETFNKRKPLKSFFHFPNVWLVGDSVEPEILTDSSVPIVNYENLVKTGWSHSNINELKILLANEATAMLHGEKAAYKAEETAKKTFGKGSVGDDLPSIMLKKGNIKNGINIIDLVVLTNLLTSKSEVRRTIKNKGIKVNNNPVEDEKFIVSLENFNNENILKLSHGKKNHVVIKIN